MAPQARRQGVGGFLAQPDSEGTRAAAALLRSLSEQRPTGTGRQAARAGSWPVPVAVLIGAHWQVRDPPLAAAAYHHTQP